MSGPIMLDQYTCDGRRCICWCRKQVTSEMNDVYWNAGDSGVDDDGDDNEVLRERCRCVVVAGVNKTWCLSTMLTTMAAIALLPLTASMI